MGGGAEVTSLCGAKKGLRDPVGHLSLCIAARHCVPFCFLDVSSLNLAVPQGAAIFLNQGRGSSGSISAASRSMKRAV
jgi:hypothetical protein